MINDNFFIFYHDGFEYWAFFKFNLTDKPEGYIEAEVVLITLYPMLIVPILVPYSNWTEESITWNNKPGFGAVIMLSFSFSLSPPDSFFHYIINITDYIDNVNVSFILMSPSSVNEYNSGYSKEYTDEDTIPKMIWTYEDEHTIEDPSNLLENIIFGSVELIIGIIITAIPLIKRLRKRDK